MSIDVLNVGSLTLGAALLTEIKRPLVRVVRVRRSEFLPRQW